MYVCNCAGVTERDIHEALDRGARSVKDLRRELNVANDCCQCVCDVKRCLREHQAMCQAVDPQFLGSHSVGAQTNQQVNQQANQQANQQVNQQASNQSALGRAAA